MDVDHTRPNREDKKTSIFFTDCVATDGAVEMSMLRMGKLIHFAVTVGTVNR